jgi:hypothetical protein
LLGPLQDPRPWNGKPISHAHFHESTRGPGPGSVGCGGNGSKSKAHAGFILASRYSAAWVEARRFLGRNAFGGNRRVRRATIPARRSVAAKRARAAPTADEGLYGSAGADQGFAAGDRSPDTRTDAGGGQPSFRQAESHQRNEKKGAHKPHARNFQKRSNRGLKIHSGLRLASPPRMEKLPKSLARLAHRRLPARALQQKTIW